MIGSDSQSRSAGMRARGLGGIPDFNGHLLTENSEGGLDLLGLSSMCGIEHAADYALMNAEAADCCNRYTRQRFVK